MTPARELALLRELEALTRVAAYLDAHWPSMASSDLLQRLKALRDQFRQT